jgi:serine/threonine-protein kinase RsbW
VRAPPNAIEFPEAPPPLTHMRVAVDVEIPSDIKYIERVVELVRSECAGLSLPARVCSLNVPVALTEAISNAIMRGNLEDIRKHVRVRACIDEREVVLEVADEGAGFDRGIASLDPTSPENIQKEDGRGLFLMRTLMDRVELFHDGGTVIRLTLRRE